MLDWRLGLWEMIVEKRSLFLSGTLARLDREAPVYRKYMLSRAGIPRHAIIKKFAGADISKLEDLISVLPKLCRGDRVPLEYTYYKDCVKAHIPLSCMLDGVRLTSFSGTGVIIYHSVSIGLVAVDRNTVPISASDVMMSFAACPIEIPGEVVFLHPTHNFALISYVPSALGDDASMIRTAELLPEPALNSGEPVYLVGLTRSLRATSRKSFVTNPCASLVVGSTNSPRYKATNIEVIVLDTDFGNIFSGVLADELGRVQAIWGSFSTQVQLKNNKSLDQEFVKGIPVYIISQILDKIICSGDTPSHLIKKFEKPLPLLRILEVELHPTLLSKARNFGLSVAWIKTLMKKDPIRRQVLRVGVCLAGSRAENFLKHGDMVLAINKEPITCYNDIDHACQDLEQCSDKEGKLMLTIFREGSEIGIAVETDVTDGKGTTRVVNWCGCLVQDPHPAVRALGFLPEEGHGVYVARGCHGCPVDRYGLHSCQWIVEVNGKRTPDLDAFVAVTKELEHVGSLEFFH